MKIRIQAVKTILCALALGVSTTVRAASPPLPAPNGDMGTVPSGWFMMGDANDGNLNGDAPRHNVFVNTFQIDTNLISFANWQLVYNWALNNGYDFGTNTAGSGVGADYPATGLTWYDAVKWCNARSEREGLTPCYYTSTNNFGPSTIYKSAQVVLRTNYVKWDADGYRLPTEAEWEKAARGGLVTNRFPWGMTISHAQAWYKTPGATPFSYELTPDGWNNNPTSATTVGRFAPNGFGLYDMAGNVSEWCWDFYSSEYYSSSPRPTNNPTGAAPASTRVTRGGHWFSYANSLCCAARAQTTATIRTDHTGFRCVRLASGKTTPTVIVTPGSYFYSGAAQGPGEAEVDTGGSSGAIALSYTGTSYAGAAYAPNATPPTAAGSYTVTATVAAHALYNQGVSAPTAFTINKATPSVTINVGTYIFNGSAQGPNVTNVNKGGSTGSVTLSYSGTGYGPMPTPPTAAGNYSVTATVATDGNYTTASSSPTAFTIQAANLSGIVDFQSLTNLIGTNVIDLASLRAVLSHYAHTNNGGVVDPVALTSFVGTNVVTLPELMTVLNNYAHNGFVDYGALTNFLANDAVRTNDLFAVLRNFYAPGGKIPAGTLTALIGTNTVDQAGLNAVLAHYWASFPPYISNVTFAGTNFTYTVTNFTFAVQVNTNLANPTNWQDIGHAVFQFTDTNAANSQSGFYRLVAPTNQ